MPCTALTVDYPHQDRPTMPVPVTRKLHDGPDYLNYFKITSGYNNSTSRRATTSTTSPSSYSTDTLSKYSTSRTGVSSSRTNSITEDLRDRSQTREVSTRTSRDTSRNRANILNYSTDYTTSTSTKLRKPTIYTTSELNEFRKIYGPNNYIIGSSRSSSEFGRPLRTSIDTNTNTITSKYRTNTLLKEKKSEALENISNTSSNTTTTTTSTTTTINSNNTSNNTNNLEGNLSPRHRSLLNRKDSFSSINSNNGLSGLRNIGNTCFLNSVVQCLSNTRILKEFLIRRDFISDLRNSESRGALIKSFADVVTELWSGEGKIVNPSAFKSQVQRYAPRFMGYNQQDAQEFLRYLLEGLHDDINRVQIKPKNLPEIDDHLSDSVKSSESWKQYLRCDDSRIVDLFVGQLKSTLQCTTCGHSSTTFEVFWDLSLPLPSRTGSLRLSQCLDHFTKEEILDGDEMPTCSKCKTRRKCTKRFSIQKFPKILVLHLKRFSPNERYRKLSATVEFPLTNLDMSAYSSTTQASSYNLYAVSNHSGTAHSGHYTAYCLHSGTNQWYEFNDSRVSTISSRNVVSSEAYILFYEQSNGITTSRL